VDLLHLLGRVCVTLSGSVVWKEKNKAQVHTPNKPKDLTKE